MVRRWHARQVNESFLRHFIDVPCLNTRSSAVFLSVGTNVRFFLLNGKTFFETRWERGTGRDWQGALSALSAGLSSAGKLSGTVTMK